MRLSVSLLLLAALFLTSCANEGVIVQKNSRPHPLYHSVGIEGVYTFVLRDNAGGVHRQMVTPDVFERYAVGDYFNDLQPGASRSESSDAKTVRTAMRPASAEVPRRTASGTNPAKPSRLATKTAKDTRKSQKAVAKRTTTRSRKGNSALARRSKRGGTSAKSATASKAKAKPTVATASTSKPAETPTPATQAPTRPVENEPSIEVTSPKKDAVPVSSGGGGAGPDEPRILFMPPRVR